MPLSTLKNFILPPSDSNPAASLSRDITWDRPVFRPPVLPNPRMIFDPMPFTAHRINAIRRQNAKA